WRLARRAMRSSKPCLGAPPAISHPCTLLITTDSCAAGFRQRLGVNLSPRAPRPTRAAAWKLPYVSAWLARLQPAADRIVARAELPFVASFARTPARRAQPQSHRAPTRRPSPAQPARGARHRRKERNAVRPSTRQRSARTV